MISVWAGSLEGLHVCHVLPEASLASLHAETHTRTRMYSRKPPFFLTARQESVFICPID